MDIEIGAYLIGMLLIWLYGVHNHAEDIQNPYTDTGITIFMCGVFWPILLVVLIGVGIFVTFETAILKGLKINIWRK